MTIAALESKLKEIKSMVDDLILREMTPVKHLAAVLGKVISLEPSHGMLVRITTRSGYASLAAYTEVQGWSGCVGITESVKKELSFLSKHLFSMNGTLIKSSLLEVRLESIIKDPVAKQLNIPNHERAEKIVVSDSSDWKAYVYDLSEDKKTVISSNFSEDQKKLSSGARELLAVWFALNQWKTTGSLKNKNVYWLTDSENVVSFIRKGSCKPEVQELLFKITQLAFELGIHIEPIHLLRTDPRIIEADEHSKVLDSDNWSVDHHSFEIFREQYPLETDMFADEHNARLEKFCSLYYSAKALAVDAFSTNWKEMGFMWLCPPVSLLIKIHQRICISECEGLLIMPLWKSSSFYNLYFDATESAKHPFQVIYKWHPYIFQNENARKTALFGDVPFMFGALTFCTRK
jgi:hypothetical protein